MNLLAAPVVIAGVGARTAVGMTGPATAAAVRAGIAGFDSHPFMMDTAGSRMIVALAPYLSIDVSGVERLSNLAVPAAAEALAQPVVGLGSKSAVPVFIGMSQPRPGRSGDLAVVAKRVATEVSASGLPVGKLSIIQAGHAAGTMAVQAAWEAIHSGGAEFALAGGVDSYMDPDTLEWLEAKDQLHSAGLENNPYGFIPGEAAGFVLLASAAMAERYNFPAILELLAVVTTWETRLIKTDTVCLGEGLTALFHRLAATHPNLSVNHLYCDMNGEPYRADEFGFATIRAGKVLADPSAFTAPADCWGDVGSASGPLFLLLAKEGRKKGYAPGPVLAGFTSSETGERCGFLVHSRHTGGVR